MGAPPTIGEPIAVVSQQPFLDSLLKLLLAIPKVIPVQGNDVPL